VDAIVVGGGTVFADDPLLTARPPGPRVAARVVVTLSGNLPESCQLRATAREVPVIVYTPHQRKLEGWIADGVEVFTPIDGAMTLDSVLADLGRRRFTNVLIEGGAKLFGSVFDARAADELHVFIAPKLIGGTRVPSPVGGLGVERMADALSLERMTFEPSGADIYVHGFARPRT
jgi:diaminohydroxyphosphoribosylaminopyrimidine deaminase/5-amino-6-(5-phosphoribosylamino)uracil reductase